MQDPAFVSHTDQFGTFEVDLRPREFCPRSLKLKPQEQHCRVMATQRDRRQPVRCEGSHKMLRPADALVVL